MVSVLQLTTGYSEDALQGLENTAGIKAKPVAKSSSGARAKRKPSTKQKQHTKAKAGAKK